VMFRECVYAKERSWIDKWSISYGNICVHLRSCHESVHDLPVGGLWGGCTVEEIEM